MLSDYTGNGVVNHCCSAGSLREPWLGGSAPDCHLPERLWMRKTIYGRLRVMKKEIPNLFLYRSWMWSPSPKKRPAGPLKEGLGGNSPRTPSAVLGAESTAAFSRNLRSVVALVPAAVGPTPRTPEMPTLSSQSRAPSRSSSRSAREVPVNDASEVGETEPPDGACSFPLHLV